MEQVGDFLQTFTGRRIFPLSPNVDDIDIEDIAHSLSMMCRFGGHCLRFYSVAEHSILMTMRTSKPNKLWTLLHDASEAYLVDVPRPLKKHIVGYSDIEKNLMEMICTKYGLPLEMPSEVKELDAAILSAECSKNMATMPENLPFSSAPLNVRFQYWSPTEAKERFLALFWSLYRDHSR